MNENKLTKEEERLLAELAETKYFDALLRLASVKGAEGINSLITKTLPNEELRYWQGFVWGVRKIPDEILIIKDKIRQEGFGD